MGPMKQVLARAWACGIVAVALGWWISSCSSDGGESGSGGAGNSAGGSGAATTTSGGGTGTTTSTSSAGGSLPCSAGAAVPCATPLPQRLLATAVTTTGSPGTVFFATEPGGCAEAAWSDGSAVHVTPLDGAGQRLAADLTTTGSEIRGLVAHDDGAAVLVVRQDEMVLVRLLFTAATQFENIIVGNNAHQNDGDRWIDGWPHEGRLAWSGSSYAAYFGQTGNWGAQGNHQGDHLATFDAQGNPGGEGWDWGCSHSLDVRITHNGTRFGPVCLADCYPGKGIYFNHDQALISNEPSGNCAGGSSAALGGLVGASDGFWFTYLSTEGRPSHDVALVHVDNSGVVGAPTWLTSTDNVEESNAQLVRYGSGMLAAWSAGADIMFAALDANGALVEGPVAVTTTLPAGSDLAVFPSGDVGWAYADGGGLSVVHLARCE
jgi:hypothetical protein